MAAEAERRLPAGAGGRRFFALVALELSLVALLLFACAYAARDLLPLSPRQEWPPELERRAPPLARYDSGWYLTIVERGYGPAPPQGQASAHAFFPLYPVLVRSVTALLPVDGFAAGQIVSLICFFAAGLLFAEEGRCRHGEVVARRALRLLLLYPTSFFLLAMYSESLFLLLALLAFRQTRRGRFGFAALFALLAGLTRAPAIALALPLALAAREARGPGDAAGAGARGALPGALLVGAAPVAGVLLWILGVGWLSGEPLLYFRVQRAWERGASPLSGFARFLEALPAWIARGDFRGRPGLPLDYLHALLFLAIGILQAKRRRLADAAWTAGALLLPIATGIAASLPRYLVVVYPAFFTLADFLEDKPKTRLLWWIGSAALLAAGTAAFVRWRWVA